MKMRGGVTGPEMSLLFLSGLMRVGLGRMPDGCEPGTRGPVGFVTLNKETVRQINRYDRWHGSV